MNNNEIRDNLNQLASTIEEAKSSKSRLEGKLEELFNTLKKTYKVKTLEEAEDKIIKLSHQIDDHQEKIKKHWAYFQEFYEWN